MSDLRLDSRSCQPRRPRAENPIRRVILCRNPQFAIRIFCGDFSQHRSQKSVNSYAQCGQRITGD